MRFFVLVVDLLCSVCICDVCGANVKNKESSVLCSHQSFNISDVYKSAHDTNDSIRPVSVADGKDMSVSDLLDAQETMHSTEPVDNDARDVLFASSGVEIVDALDWHAEDINNSEPIFFDTSINFCPECMQWTYLLDER